jgi:hypothetical protein
LPTGITVTPTTLNLDKDDTYPLVAAIQPTNANSTVTWTSSAPAIATVDANGIVTALAAGKATITAKTINNYSAICNVTVTVPVTRIVIDPAECTIPLKGTKILKATVYPTDATNKTIIWSSSDATIATVNTSGIVTAKSVNGEVEIYVTAANGVVGKCVITVGSGKIADANDVETQGIASLQVYPNPTSGELRVETGEWRVENIEIYDVMGRLCHVETLRATSVQSTPATINISHLPTGVYFIRIQTETEIVIKKVIKQ